MRAILNAISYSQKQEPGNMDRAKRFPRRWKSYSGTDGLKGAPHRHSGSHL